MQQIIFKLHL